MVYNINLSDIWYVDDVMLDFTEFHDILAPWNSIIRCFATRSHNQNSSIIWLNFDSFLGDVNNVTLSHKDSTRANFRATWMYGSMIFFVCAYLYWTFWQRNVQTTPSYRWADIKYKRDLYNTCIVSQLSRNKYMFKPNTIDPLLTIPYESIVTGALNMHSSNSWFFHVFNQKPWSIFFQGSTMVVNINLYLILLHHPR